jgi:hypothetical protein
MLTPRDRPDLGSQRIVELSDDVHDRFNDLARQPVDGAAWHRDILQRYMDGQLVVHFHFLHRHVGGWCVAVGNPVEGPFGAHLGVEPRSGNDAYGQPGRPMLVFVYKFMETPQRLPAVVGLNRLDQVQHCGGDFSVSPAVATLNVRLLSAKLVQRERGDPPITLATSDGGIEKPDGQLPRNVVERRSGISQAVPENHAEFDGRVLEDEQGPSGRIWLVLHEHHVRVRCQIIGNAVSQVPQVLLCPDDFVPRSVQRMRHA